MAGDYKVLNIFMHNENPIIRERFEKSAICYENSRNGKGGQYIYRTTHINILYIERGYICFNVI